MRPETNEPPPMVRDLLTPADRGSDGTNAGRLIGCGFPAHPVPVVDPRIVALKDNPCPFVARGK